MLITKISPVSGKKLTRELNITKQDYDLWKEEGWLIQDAMPNLSPDEREFIMSGITADEWDMLFAEDEESEDGQTT